MASVGDISLALFSGQQKASLSAASLNFDFTLVKIAADPEYQQVGRCLSHRRKVEAEDGPLHVVARRLGALFAGELPSVPNLISAYGTRASEILSNVKLSPPNRKAYSVFGDHVGADATSLWAAATSGKTTPTIHLLACMLARLWPPAEAVSIWTELVTARKTMLQRRVQADEFQLTDLLSANVEISRDQLAASWIQSADSVYAPSQKKLLLFLDQLRVGLRHSCTENSVYQTWMRWWHQGLEVLDKLIAGIPQSTQSTDVVLPLASWHIYPDMVVLYQKDSHLRQKDPLVAVGGILTIGIRENRSDTDSALVWSIPLSHLRYYGRPVPSNRELNICTSRIHFEQLTFLSLGALTRGWSGGVDLVVRFMLALSKPWNLAGKRMPEWLMILFEASQWFTSLEGRQKQEAEQIFYFGRRRCESMFSSEKSSIPEAFGLCEITRFIVAIGHAERRITWLRSFCAQQGLLRNCGPVVIRYYPDKEVVHQNTVSATSSQNRQLQVCKYGMHVGHPDDRRHRPGAEYATLYSTNDLGHRRWISADEIRDPRYEDWLMDKLDQCCPWRLRTRDPERSQEEGRDCYVELESPSSLSVHRVHQLHNQTGEFCGLVRDSTNYIDTHDQFSLPLDGAPLRPLRLNELPSHDRVFDPTDDYFDRHGVVQHTWQTMAQGNSAYKRRKTAQCGDPGCPGKWYLPRPFRREFSMHFHSVLGDNSTAAVFCQLSDTGPRKPSLPRVLDLVHVTEKLEEGLFSAVALEACFQEPHYLQWGFDPTRVWTSLEVLIAASEVYRELPDSTIDIGVTAKPLHNAQWFAMTDERMQLARHFACIAMFENGGLDIEPEELEKVIAISSGSSLYIAAKLLQDPCTEDHAKIIVHTVGNVGKRGMSFIITPADEPLMYEPDRSEWQLVRHEAFDGRLECNIRDTTLHLSFTGYELPLRTLDHGSIDQEAFFVQAVVRAFERDQWVADLDVLYDFEYEADWQLMRRLASCEHAEHERNQHNHLQITAVDSWIEFLDPPHTAYIVRAKDDWISRLAFFTVAARTGRPLILASNHVCWLCVEQIAAELLPPDWPKDALWVNRGHPNLMILC